MNSFGIFQEMYVHSICSVAIQIAPWSSSTGHPSLVQELFFHDVAVGYHDLDALQLLFCKEA